MATPTAQQALDLMYRASTTGVSNAELAKFGGYAAVKAAAQAASFDATPTYIQSYEQSNALPASASTIANQQAAATTAEARPTRETGMTIQQAYQQVLGRTPNAEEIAYWQTQFENSVDATELSTFSVAAQPERAAAPTTYPKIREMYLSVLGREPDAAGLKYFYDRFGDEVSGTELDIFKGMTIQEQTANAARNAAVTAGTTTGTTTGAGTVQPIVRPTGPRQVTGTQLAPASFAQTAITGTPYTNVYTPSNVQQNAPRLSDIQAAAQSTNPYQSLMALTPQRTLSPAYYAAQAGQTTANTNLGGFNPAIYNPAATTAPLTGLLAGGSDSSGGSNAGDARGPGTTNTGGIPGLNIDPFAVALATAARPFMGSAVSLGPRAPVTTGVFNPVGTSNAGGDYGGTGGVTGGADTMGFGGEYAKGGKVNMAPQKYDPPGPDDGYAALDNGEYVIRKSAVKKYGANIFEQINAGKIPAKRLKSLLE
jgi:hypothetical protein